MAILHRITGRAGVQIVCGDDFSADEAKDWLVKCMVDGMAEVLTEVPVVVDAEITEAW